MNKKSKPSVGPTGHYVDPDGATPGYDHVAGGSSIASTVESVAARDAKNKAITDFWDDYHAKWNQKHGQPHYRNKINQQQAEAEEAFNKEHPWVKDKNWAADHVAPIHSKQGGMTNADFDEVFNNYLEKIKNHKF